MFTVMPGARVLVYPTAKSYSDRTGKIATVERELGDDERDPEVGRMFTVRFEDGFGLDTFEDELDAIP